MQILENYLMKIGCVKMYNVFFIKKCSESVNILLTNWTNYPKSILLPFFDNITLFFVTIFWFTYYYINPYNLWITSYFFFKMMISKYIFHALHMYHMFHYIIFRNKTLQFPLNIITQTCSGTRYFVNFFYLIQKLVM